MLGPLRARALAIVSLVVLLFSASAQAWQVAPAAGEKPLASYLPEKNLLFLVEWDGLARHSKEWDATAAHKMLSETSLGKMLRETVVQTWEGFRAGNPQVPPLSGDQITGLAGHLLRQGFLIGVCGSSFQDQPEAVSLVIRDAKTNPVFTQLLEGRPLGPNAGGMKKELNGRTSYRFGPTEYWFEGNDFVLSMVSGETSPTLRAFLGEIPSAVNHPSRKHMFDNPDLLSPVGWGFVDATKVPIQDPKAKQMLAGIKTAGFRWGLKGQALVTQIGVETVEPKGSLLSFLDQPPLDIAKLPPVPAQAENYTLFSVSPAATYDKLIRFARQNDPALPDQIVGQLGMVQQRLGIDLKRDLADQLGPAMAAFSLPSKSQGSIGGGMLDLWFFLPKGALVVGVKDRATFATTLEKLMNSVNRELSALGGMFVGRGQGVRADSTQHAEFRKLKGEEIAYTLAIPPAVLPTPGSLHLTVMLGKENLVIATTPDVARSVLKAEGNGKPAGLTELPAGTTVFSRTDPRDSLPELLVNIPSAVQVLGAMITNQQRGIAGLAPHDGMPAGDQAPVGNFALKLDPDLIPDTDALRGYLFPKVSTLAVTERTIVFTTTEAFPAPDVSMGAGTSAPVLVALLLPAVPSAREAARRAQCTNNLKMIGLAMHNYADVNGGFPGNICDKNGKPLLSWRVAILPYIEQQALYNKFHLDERWDSPHNIELSRYVVKTYACPSRPFDNAKPETHYRTFVGNGALFENGQNPKIAMVTDGTSNTIMVAETQEGVLWTKPDDIEFNPENPGQMFGIGSPHSGGANVLFADGSVRFIINTINLEVLKALITRAGGEVVGGNY